MYTRLRRRVDPTIRIGPGRIDHVVRVNVGGPLCTLIRRPRADQPTNREGVAGGSTNSAIEAIDGAIGLRRGRGRQGMSGPAGRAVS